MNITLKPSEINNDKSFLAFELYDLNNSKPIGDIYTLNENLTDGFFYINIKVNNYFESDSYIIEIKECIVNFLKIAFKCWPINKIYINCYNNEINLINLISNIGFKCEADLKEDYYVNGKFINKEIFAIYRKEVINE